jgi:AcrR family transcriptional regulator
MHAVHAGVSRQVERSRRTRERVITSTVSLICKEGLPSASPSRITQHVGMSWGAVQHHFGSKEQLLKTIVLLSRDRFHEAVSAPSYEGLGLSERMALFVDAAWQHYQSDVFRASVEISFWHRNSGLAIADDVTSDDGRTSNLTRVLVEKVFAGLGVPTGRLVEALEYMHCVLTGLAFQEILVGSRTRVERHLTHCEDAMVQIALEGSA